jgi:RimJ/RimL family protein N-acetyltransferase
MAPIQSITTERLILRAHCAEDFDDLHAMWSDPAVTRHIGGKAFSREEVWARMLRYAGIWSLFGYGMWAVRERASGDFVGDVGFLNLRRNVVPTFGDRPELGFVLAPKAHGQGYATEAARAALEWGDRTWGERETVCMIAPENAASIRVAVKLGYREVSRSDYMGDSVILFARRGVHPGSA